MDLSHPGMGGPGAVQRWFGSVLVAVRRVLPQVILLLPWLVAAWAVVGLPGVLEGSVGVT